MRQTLNPTTNGKVIKRPFLLCGISVIINLLPMMFFGQHIVLSVYFLLSVTGCIICFIYPVYTKPFFIILICAIVSCSSFSLADLRLQTALSSEGKNRLVTGTVNSFIQANGDNSYSFYVSDCKVENKKIPGKIYVYTYKNTNIKPGDKIYFTANELTLTAKEGIFFLHSLSDRTYLTAYGTSEITVTGKDTENSLYYGILLSAKLTREKFFLNMNSDEAAVTTSLITGDKDFLSNEIISHLRQSGISHIFAVSGMHLSVWTGLFFIIFQNRARSRVILNILAGIFVLFYIVFTGFSPSVLRAGIMLLCVFAGRILKRSAETLNSLGLAVTILLIYEPFLCGNISFILSCISTFTLITASQKLSSFPGYKHQKGYLFRKAVYYVTNSLKISVAVIISTLLPVTLFFGYISVVSPVSSLLMTPFAEGIMLTGAAAALLPQGSVIGRILFGICEFFSGILINYVKFTGQLSFSTLTVQLKNVIICAVISIVIYLLIPAIIKQKRSLTAFVLIFSSTFLILAGVTAAEKNDETEIFIPAATGNCTVSVYKKGLFSAIYCPGKDYSAAVQHRSFLAENGIMQADFLFLPDYTVKDFSNHTYLKRNLLPIKIYEADENKAESGFCFEAALSNTKIYSESSKDFAAAVFMTDNVKTVMLINCEDENPLPLMYNNADILICSGSIPDNIIRENYSDIILLTNEDTKQSEDIYTNQNRSLKITVKGEDYAIY